MLDVLARLLPWDPHPHSVCAAGGYAECAIYCSTLSRQHTLSRLFANNIPLLGITEKNLVANNKGFSL